MVQRKAVRPAEVAGEDVDWLSADLSSDTAAEYCRLFAKALVVTTGRQEVGRRQLAKLAGISHSTIGAIIDGRTVPDLATVARLEKALGVELLPTPRLRK